MATVKITNAAQERPRSPTVVHGRAIVPKGFMCVVVRATVAGMTRTQGTTGPAGVAQHRVKVVSCKALVRAPTWSRRQPNMGYVASVEYAKYRPRPARNSQLGSDQKQPNSGELVTHSDGTVGNNQQVDNQ